MKCFGKMLLTALAGWAALNVAMFLTFRVLGFGLDGHGIDESAGAKRQAHRRLEQRAAAPHFRGRAYDRRFYAFAFSCTPYFTA
jgi:hypothetical protein